MFKKILLSIVILMMFCGVAISDVSKDRIRFDTMATTDGVVREVRLMIDDMNTQLRNAGGRTSNAGTGDTYYVDSNAGSDAKDGTSPANAVATLNVAIDLCTANNGDVIVLVQGHAETLTAADAIDADKAGIAFIGLGDGTDSPAFSYTTAAAEFVVGAANMYLYNLRFLAATQDILIGVSIEDAGDNCTIVACTFPEPATISDEFVDAIDLGIDADGFEIYNCVYRHVSTTGPEHFIEAGNGRNSEMRIVGNNIAGEFSIAAIWSDTADTWTYIKGNDIANLTSGEHAIEFTAAAEGMLLYNNLYADSTNTALDPGSMFCIENYVCQAINESGSLVPGNPYGNIGDIGEKKP